MEKIYTIEDNKIVEHDLDEVRREVNWLNGCPMPSGARPKYEIKEDIEYRVMQAGEDGYADRTYSTQSDEEEADDDLKTAQADEPDRKAWIDEILVYIIGYNQFGKFHEFARYDSMTDAEDHLNRCLDELIERDERVGYYWSLDQAQVIIAKDKE